MPNWSKACAKRVSFWMKSAVVLTCHFELGRSCRLARVPSDFTQL
jgi:hypothetical protein